jgi:hypothetical protein
MGGIYGVDISALLYKVRSFRFLFGKTLSYYNYFEVFNYKGNWTNSREGKTN